jgi:hypothetical protein
MLYLVGNPLALSSQYRDIVKQRFIDVKLLDGIATLNEGSSPKKKKKKSVLTGPMIQIADTLTFDLQFRVLSNIDGIYLTEDNCKIEILDAVTEDEKCSTFWLSYQNHLGE